MSNRSSPSKKVVALGIVCLSVLSAVAIYKWLPRYEPENPILTTISPDLTLSITATQTDRDSDGDGLLDWQEGLWGTNPQEKDSDNDKTPDGAEVQAGRNPTLAGPDDLQATSSLAAGLFPDSVAQGFDNSLSGNITKEMFYSFINTKQDRGIAFSTEDITQITSELTASAENSRVTFEKYSLDSIGTFPDSDLERAEEYGDKFAQIYIDTEQKLNKLSNDDIESILREQIALAKSLSILYVPQSLQRSHAQIVNDTYNAGVIYEILSNYENDPIKAIVAVKSLRAIEERKVELFTTIANYFRRNAIIFTNPTTKALWENF